jgi:uncharacterized membrane protein
MIKAIMQGGAIKRYFLTGVFVLLPIGATALVMTWLFNLLDSWATPLTQRIFGHHIPGLGLVITASVITFTGFLSSNVIGRWLLRVIDRMFMDVPIFKTIYNTTKQVMQVFSPQAQNAFRSVVFVEDPNVGNLRIGFVTHEVHLDVNGKKDTHLAVYIPTNHLYFGDIYLCKPDQVHVTGLTVQQGIQSVISAGAILPPELKTETFRQKNNL